MELAADRVADSLRTAITRGDLPPDTPLRDAGLAVSHDVSRNTVREAFRMLRSDGLVIHQLHKGVVVRSIQAADVRDIYTVRRTLELRAIEESGLAGENELADLLACVRTAEDAVARQAWRDVGTASLDFHRRLVGLLASSSLDQFFAVVLARLRLAFATMRDEREFHEPWVPRDRDIAELIVAGRRADAHTTMRIYLDDSEHHILDVVRSRTAEKNGRRARRPKATTRQPSKAR